MGSPQQLIRTIVVDDSATALQSVCSLLAREENVVVVGQAANGQEALALARRLQPDLALLDVEMPIMSGIEATSRLTQACPGTRVIIVTVHDSPELRKVCQERGACGFVAKAALRDELPVLIRQLFGHAETTLPR